MNPWILRLAPPLGVGYLQLVKLTSRYLVEGLENVRDAEEGGKSAIMAVWHNRLLGAIALHTHRNFGALISQSDDGELIARVVERMGYTALRGSTTRGGTGALRAVIKHARKGHHLVFTPDGPKGPRYQVQQGVAYAALRTGLPVVPVGVGAKRKVVFGSWDRFQLPLPFGRVQVVYGKPLRFTGGEDIEEVREAIRSALAAVTEEADARLGVVSP